MKKYDIDALKLLPIDEVVEALGGMKGQRSKNYHCFNGVAHSDGMDQHPSLGVDKRKNIAKCFACGIGGDPVSLATKAFSGDFKRACEFLHDAFGIPYLDGEKIEKRVPSIPFGKKIKEIPVNYMSFTGKEPYHRIRIKDFLDRYGQLKEAQKLKLVYSYIYRNSLLLEEEEKNKKAEYLNKRKMNHPLSSMVGFLGENKIGKVIESAKNLFGEEDLVKFNIINGPDHKKNPLGWKYGKDVLVFPSFDLCSDLVTGMMLRPIKKPHWFSGKEWQLSATDIVKPLPFGVIYGELTSKNIFFVTEGAVDALSLPGNYGIVAMPGVYGYRQEMLGLFRGKTLVWAFDMDDKGSSATLKAQKFVTEAGNIRLYVLYWDEKRGKDINELKINGKLKDVLLDKKSYVFAA